MYIKARKGCDGEFILLNAGIFTLFELPKDCHPKINIDRTPLEVSRDNDSIYYKFHERRLPDEYFTPLYIQWYKDIKKFFRRPVSCLSGLLPFCYISCCRRRIFMLQ